ncbi:MAG: VOC family protein, partial [Spirochaetales bacterium]|nr:VOC family protein [Spirochaetales bacterium]
DKKRVIFIINIIKRKEKMNEPILESHALCQVGIIVKDIRKAVAHYSTILGVSPPEIMTTGPLEEAHTEYKGASTDARAKLAFFDMGQVSIELIEPSSGPSTWREFLETHGPGIHHIAFKTNDAEDVVKKMKKEDIDVVQQGDYPGGRYVYCDAEKTLGIIIELLQDVK